jgi:hypothetical protein
VAQLRLNAEPITGHGVSWQATGSPHAISYGRLRRTSTPIRVDGYSGLSPSVPMTLSSRPSTALADELVRSGVCQRYGLSDLGDHLNARSVYGIPAIYWVQMLEHVNCRAGKRPRPGSQCHDCPQWVGLFAAKSFSGLRRMLLHVTNDRKAPCCRHPNLPLEPLGRGWEATARPPALSAPRASRRDMLPSGSEFIPALQGQVAQGS